MGNSRVFYAMLPLVLASLGCLALGEFRRLSRGPPLRVVRRKRFSDFSATSEAGEAGHRIAKGTPVWTV